MDLGFVLDASGSVGIENYRNVTEKKQRPMLVADYRAQAQGGITVVNLAEPPARLESSPTPGIVPVSNPEPPSDIEP